MVALARMLHLILYEPEIPPNTGNIIRLCANTGVNLNLVKPLGFELDEPRLKRAGLDYHEFADVAVHESLDACLETLGQPRLFALSTRGTTRYDLADYADGDALLMGPETRGLPQALLDALPVEQREVTAILLRTVNPIVAVGLPRSINKGQVAQ